MPSLAALKVLEQNGKDHEAQSEKPPREAAE
jgi:hypothetical protein